MCFAETVCVQQVLLGTLKAAELTGEGPQRATRLPGVPRESQATVGSGATGLVLGPQ